jgi:hypothetical protein
MSFLPPCFRGGGLSAPALTGSIAGIDYGGSEGSAEEALRDREAGGKPFEPDPGHAGEGTETSRKTPPLKPLVRNLILRRPRCGRLAGWAKDFSCLATRAPAPPA